MALYTKEVLWQRPAVGHGVLPGHLLSLLFGGRLANCCSVLPRQLTTRAAMLCLSNRHSTRRLKESETNGMLRQNALLSFLSIRCGRLAGGGEQIVGKPFFNNLAMVSLIAASLCSAVEHQVALRISFCEMALLTELGWWELKCSMMPLMAALRNNLYSTLPDSDILSLMSRMGRKPLTSGSSISNLIVGCLLFKWASIWSASFHP